MHVREPSPTRKRESMCKGTEAERSVVVEGPKEGQGCLKSSKRMGKVAWDRGATKNESSRLFTWMKCIDKSFPLTIRGTTICNI